MIDRSLPKRALIALSLFCFSTLGPTLIAQLDSHIYTVAAAKQDAARIGSNRILVTGRFWCGKEGSMIFDRGYKATLRLQYSAEFNSKHSFQELLGEARKSDVVTITGRLHPNADRGLVLIVEDIQFVQKPR
jgi:hypothetical protein